MQFTRKASPVLTPFRPQLSLDLASKIDSPLTKLQKELLSVLEDPYVAFADNEAVIRNILRSNKEEDFVNIVFSLLTAVEATYASITARAADVTGVERMKLLRTTMFLYYGVLRKFVPSEHPTLSMTSLTDLSSIRLRVANVTDNVCAGLALTAMDRYHSYCLLKIAQSYEAEENSKRTIRRNDGFWGGVYRVIQILDGRLERQLRDPNSVRQKWLDDL